MNLKNKSYSQHNTKAKDGHSNSYFLFLCESSPIWKFLLITQLVGKLRIDIQFLFSVSLCIFPYLKITINEPASTEAEDGHCNIDPKLGTQPN